MTKTISTYKFNKGIKLNILKGIQTKLDIQYKHRMILKTKLTWTLLRHINEEHK